MFSIVSPVLNARAFLPRMLASVREASGLGVSIEHIIVDGGSTDGSLEIAQAHSNEHGSPIVRILEGPDRGQSHAINRGLAMARGRYVGWLNADDMIVPAGFARFATAIAGSSAEVVLGRCRFVDLAGRTVFAPLPQEPISPESLLCLLSGWFAGRSIVQPEAFVRHDVLELLGGVDESLHYTMDHHLWVRLALAGARFQSQEIEIARQLVHPGQKTADNIAVASEMLTYARDMLADRPQSDVRARAIREIDRVASRVRQARRVVSALGRVLSDESQSQTLVVHGQFGSLPDELLREWSRRCRRRQSVLLAGLDPVERKRIQGLCPSLFPPVVVGRLPTVTAQFDLVVTTHAGFEGLSPSADPTRLLRPGGSLCVLGATPGNRFRLELQALRRAIADRVTFSDNTPLDEPVSPDFMSAFDELGRSRAIRLPLTSSVRFLSDSQVRQSGLGEIALRLHGRNPDALSGVTIVDI